MKYHSGYQGHVQVYGAEYQISTGSPIDQSHDRNVPCALYQAYGRTNKIMIPSHYECPPGWNTEYYGYLMAGDYGHKAATIHSSLVWTEVLNRYQVVLELMESCSTMLKHIVATLFLVVVESSPA